MFGNIDLLSKTLDAAWKRNEVITNNMANVNTPNFKRSDVEFESILQEYLSGSTLSGAVTHEKHLPIGVKDLNSIEHRVVTSDQYSTRLDGNNVDIDVEMAESAKNTLTYNTVSTQLQGYLTRLKSAINEGK